MTTSSIDKEQNLTFEYFHFFYFIIAFGYVFRNKIAKISELFDWEPKCIQICPPSGVATAGHLGQMPQQKIKKFTLFNIIFYDLTYKYKKIEICPTNFVTLATPLCPPLTSFGFRIKKYKIH
jgi:hypothetical protein